MKPTPSKTERIHSLDALRAIMMLLGLVIHSAITYGEVKYGSSWSLKDPVSVHESNDYIVFFVHAFRMQIFFVVAGFFAAMLFYERQPKKMLQNRVKRILFPFLLFVFLLWPTVVFTFDYTSFVFAGDPDAMTKALSIFSSWAAFSPRTTFHLWFLYYLIFLTGASVFLALIFRKLPTASKFINRTFNRIIEKPVLRIFAFATLTAFGYVFMGTSSVATSTSFIPDVNTFSYYFIFYMVGWVLFKSKHLLDTFMKLDWASAILGVVLFSIHFFYGDLVNYGWTIVLKSIMVWAFIFGFTGLFIRYASGHSSKMRYISDASYWVYLLHLSFTALIPSLIVDWPINSTLKFLTVMIGSGSICFISYHYLVRGTFIGEFLNGRRYSRKLSDIKKEQESSQVKPVLSHH
jgi:hypothetical protein